ncbi:CWF19-like protein 1 [Schistocerca gregaria]|uniref:CWF19-like protein 1 n=1 Tax=Schistocerca gregaria TaxID=7010 RepID=UPI00211E89A7|nr:CWF19-like protein 1 [Schistocerca gregaria]
MTEKIKILVCGSVDGDFTTLFKRVENVNKKNGPFEFLLCVGNFFGQSADSWQPYKAGMLKVPLPTYILGPTSDDQLSNYDNLDGCELCPNVSYIGRRGLFSAMSGLKLAYVGGTEAETDEKPRGYNFTKADVTSVRDVCLRGKPSFRGIDILATSSWPKDVTRLGQDKTVKISKESHLLSWLAVQLKPRYHFCPADEQYYERRPYRNHSSSGDITHTTRFIALARVGNRQKEKWLYALSIDPIEKMRAMELYQQTTDQTECPYSGSMLLPSITQNKEEKSNQYFFDMDAPEDHGSRKRKSRGSDGGPERKQPPVFDQGTCWFCLASPEVEKHLVISIGTEAYLALAKGGLVADHLLILPIGHHQSLASLPESVAKEIKKFKSAIKKYFNKRQKAPVFFERNYKTSHLQVQVVPVNLRVVNMLKDIFQDYAEGEGIQLDELPEHAKLDQIAPPGTPYFYAELPSGEKLFHRIKKNFPLQFGRDVLASESVLNMVDRADWRDCKVSKEEETELTKTFRASFQPFDFTV